MATTTRRRRPRETWRAWLVPGMPDPALLTRDDVLTELARDGLAVTERRLRYWEANEVLPSPVQQLHYGVVRMVYPAWYPALVRRLLGWQHEGLTLREIAPRLKATMKTDDAMWDSSALDLPTLHGLRDRLAAEYLAENGVSLRAVALELIDTHGRRTPYYLGGVS